MSLGERIQMLRKEKKMSQNDLAEKLDVSRQSVSKWETDAAKPELPKLILMAELFQVSLDELVSSEISEGNERDIDKRYEDDSVESSERGFKFTFLGLMGRTYNQTLSTLYLYLILFFAILPVNIYLYEKGVYGPVSFSFIHQFDLLVLGFLPDLPLIAVLFGIFIWRLVKKEHRYRKVKKMDLALPVIFFLLSFLLPLFFWMADSPWTSLIILAGQSGHLLVFVDLAVMNLMVSEKKVRAEEFS